MLVTKYIFARTFTRFKLRKKVFVRENIFLQQQGLQQRKKIYIPQLQYLTNASYP